MGQRLHMIARRWFATLLLPIMTSSRSHVGRPARAAFTVRIGARYYGRKVNGQLVTHESVTDAGRMSYGRAATLAKAHGGIIVHLA